MEKGDGERAKAPGLSRLEREPYSFSADRDGRVTVFRRGRAVRSLGAAASEKFLRRAQGAAPDALQLLMARATGHYRHGNER